MYCPDANEIRALRREAKNAGDLVMAIICDVALDEIDLDGDLDEDGLPDYSGGGHSANDLAEIRRWLRASAEEAAAECAAVIAEAYGA